MGCCGDNNDSKCGCSGESAETPEMTTFAFNLEKDMFDEINEAAKTNEMTFEEFVYNCLEVGLAITAGQLALIDTDQLEDCEECDDDDCGCGGGCDCSK